MADDDRVRTTRLGMPEDAEGRSPASGREASEPHTSGEQFSRLLRGALVPTLAVGAAIVAGCAALGGREAFSAALGAGLVVIFFSLSLLVMQRTAHLDPVVVMAVVLTVYTAKIVGLGAVVVLLRNSAWLSGPALSLTAITCTVVWLAFQMRAFTRLRVLVADAPSAASAGSGGPA